MHCAGGRVLRVEGDQRSERSIRNGGQELDLLGDPSATDEERQLRKQRLRAQSY
jgi:hypothetical protein